MNTATLSRRVVQYAPIQKTQSFRWWAKIQAAFYQDCRDEAGQTETPEDTAKRESKNAKRLRLSQAVADGLVAAGVPAYRADLLPMYTFDVHEETFTPIPNFRNICLIPWVAHCNRLPMLKWAEYWLAQHPHCRLWTFTTGKRCRIDELDARIRGLHRNLSLMNAEPFMHRPGARIVFAATELGTVEKTARKGSYLDEVESGGTLEADKEGHWYHPHAHCIVWFSRGRVASADFTALLKDVWNFWGHEWDDGKRISNPRELVKYVAKEGDMARLAREDPAELRRLHEVLFRKKMLRPLDELARQIRAANASNLVPKLVWEDDGPAVWRLAVNPNRRFGPRDSEAIPGFDLSVGEGKKLMAEQSERHPFAEETGATCVVPRPGSMLDDLRHKLKPRKPRERAETGGRVIAQCAPGFNSRGVKSPRVVWMGAPSKAAALGHPLVQKLRTRTADQYESGRAIAATERRELRLQGESRGTAAGAGSIIRVHNDTPTVGNPNSVSATFKTPVFS